MSIWSTLALLWATALIGSVLTPAAAKAAESVAVSSKRTVATLMSDTDSVAAGHPIRAALHLRLAPGWHTYWQNPGDAGVAPSLEFRLSAGAAASPIEWPLPQRVAEGSLTTYAYTGDVVLPFAVTPGPGALEMKAHAEWLACKDVCVPEEADLTLVLPPGLPAPAEQAGLIDAASVRVPTAAPFAATVSPGGMLKLLGSGLPSDIAAAEFFPLSSGIVERTSAQVVASDRDRLTFQIDPMSGTPKTAGSGVLAVTSKRGVVAAYVVSPELVTDRQPAPLIVPLLLFALAGGLLLNLMPCVFPILAMKAMAVARLSGSQMRQVRSEAGSYCIGVISTFVALGAGLVVLRDAGQAAGWGFQFQSPLFVTVMTWVLFAIGLNLSGVFAVGGSWMGRGDALARKGGHGGSFLTGVLAVAVASPCTAPFMGTAIAGALALSDPAAMAVFAALGLGLALPYLIIALVPRVTAVLPRPGAWMQTLQQLLAFPMYAAAVWLVWVISQQAGSGGVLLAGSGLVAIGLGGWLLGFAEQRSGWSRTIARGSIAGMVLSLAGLLYTARPDAASVQLAQPFTTAKLDQLRTQGRPVFVNMTASWCLSCLVNERIALSSSAVKDAFTQADVTYLKGDWTSQNPDISAYLHQLGRDGVPLYVLYAPGREPVILPQLLTQATVIGELAKLRDGPAPAESSAKPG